MKEKTAKKLLTVRLFKSLMNGMEQRLEAKIEGTAKHLDLKITDVDVKVHNVALLAIKTTERVIHMQETMATKQDINQINNKIDSFVGKLKEIDQEQEVQGFHIKEHERRIRTLEAS